MNALLAVFDGHPVLFVAIIAILGLLVGSFLNVVIFRMPVILKRDWEDQCRELMQENGEPPRASKRFNLLVPRSRCMKCGHEITALENIPVISYLLLKGRCSECGVSISSRYPMVEMGTAVLSAIVAWRFGPGWEMILALLFTWSLVALAGIDIDEKLLPDAITLPLLWLGLLVSLWSLPAFTDVRDAVIGAAAGYLSLWLLYHVFRLLTGKEGMGYGDFKLLAALGAWYGWQLLPLTVLLSTVVGAVVGIVLIVAGRRDRQATIPFGPYLAAAGWVALLCLGTFACTQRSAPTEHPPYAQAA
ncbi:MAG: prepilin peptidase, partial [Gammaproteobacteria bacterium]